MNTNVSSINFKAQMKMAKTPKTPKMVELSKKLQKLVENASNAELLAGSTSASAVSEAALVSKFPYIAASIAGLNSSVASTLFMDARAVKKDIANKESLIRQAGEKLQELEQIIETNQAEIEKLKAKNEHLKEHSDTLTQLLKKTVWERIFATSLWSK